MSVAKQMKVIPYKGKTISVYEIDTHGWKHYFAQVDGMTVNAPRTKDIKQAVQSAVTQIEKHMGANMSKFSLADKIMQGTDEAEKQKAERTGAIPPGERPAENPQDPAEGLPGDTSGDPMFDVPAKKTDQEMQMKPEDILNQDVATEMGAADTIEAAIKRVVIEAIKEASTPEGHVNAQAVEQMGAAKMSRMGIGKYYIDDLVKITEEQTGLPSGSVVRVLYVGGIYLIVEYKGKEFKVTKDSVVHAN